MMRMSKVRKSEFVMVGTLFNQKKVLVTPDYTNKVCKYRYLTEVEVNDDRLILTKTYEWFTKPMETSLEDGIHYIYITVEGTPIVVNRF